MSGLNIRQFAKEEPSNDPSNDSMDNQQVRISTLSEVTANDSDDSDEGIQYLAPDHQTPCGK